MQSGAPSSSINLGRALIKTGQFDEAEKHFMRVLAGDPAELEPLQFVVNRALGRGDQGLVVVLLERAIAAGAQHPELFRLLGQAHVAGGNVLSGMVALERSLAMDPQQSALWLRLGQLREAAGGHDAALIAYFRAMTSAQEQGRWRNDDTTSPELREPVKYAMAFVSAGQRRLFNAAIEPLRQQHGAAALARIDQSLAIYLGEQAPAYGHPLQRPTFLYVPGLPQAAFHPRELFGWMDELEANAAAIRDEVLAVLAADHLLEPFLGDAGDPVRAGQLRSDRGKPAWDAFFFYRHGKRYDGNCARCPATTAVIERLPLVRIDEHAPEILFSVLTPGSHILPHTGVTNARLVAHLALVVPRGCAIRVGDETREWQEGRSFVFDDTYEHEAWNQGDETRVVMIIDVWNPHLTAVEREAVSALILAIGEFHRSSGWSSDAQSQEQSLRRSVLARS